MKRDENKNEYNIFLLRERSIKNREWKMVILLISGTG
jgi:hypothetical protein